MKAISCFRFHPETTSSRERDRRVLDEQDNSETRRRLALVQGHSILGRPAQHLRRVTFSEFDLVQSQSWPLISALSLITYNFLENLAPSSTGNCSLIAVEFSLGRWYSLAKVLSQATTTSCCIIRHRPLVRPSESRNLCGAEGSRSC